MKEKKTSWLDKKLENPKFKDLFQEEYEKLSIGEQLVKLRLAAGLTQAELAKRLRTTASAVSRYESAEYDRYELKTLRKIAKACGATVHLVLEPNPKGKRAA
jgi:ribosome-binding protein aMBF1 (putative translation factor)